MDNKYVDGKSWLDSNEIERIQNDISASLYGSSTASDATAMSSADTITDYVMGPARVYPSASNPYSTVYQPGGYMSSGEPTHASFYKETIKNAPPLTRNRNRGVAKWVAIALIISTLGMGIFGLGVGVAIPWAQNRFNGLNNRNPVNTVEATPSVSETTDQASLEQLPPKQPVIVSKLSEIVKVVAPCVVSVSITMESPYGGMWDMPIEEIGSGSGIIFHHDAEKIYIATNYHVIEGATSVTIKIEDSKEIKASFVGSDPKADLAVVSVSKRDIEAAGVNSISLGTFGDSDDMVVGADVVAIGNAMGEGNIATGGIISATDKEIIVEDRTLKVLQTDAAINPGNSGGPLVNLNGEVIGINTAKMMSTLNEDVEGMGYAIPSSIALPILEGLLDAKPRPYLGILGGTLTGETLSFFYENYNVQLPGGVYIEEVLPDTSAGKAGIARTDIITSFNGVTIDTFESLSTEIQKCQVGDMVEVKVIRIERDGMKTHTFMVTLLAYQSDNF
ncbi:MAG: trypsin-like peptidase domain-containing protein [Clostridiales bacterium]|jgi:serine protease Do|nr:trypsin-like peptidase domain-containing protein [Clostridiales bacterium]